MNGSSKKVYDANGTSINTIHELKMHETYYISEVSILKEDFKSVTGRAI